ncbi:MAG TPA: hypothetical protein VNU68_32280, partial [Verrucomicrobiae bacterium]|nr:hypothetical protein [Verrucomicrobiae bacterium]
MSWRALGRAGSALVAIGGLTLLAWGAMPAAQAAQTIHGEVREADYHSVVNFRALALMEQRMSRPFHYKTNPPLMPHQVGTNNVGDGGGGAGAALGPGGGGGGGPFEAAAVPPLASPAPTSTFPALTDDLTTTPPDTHGAVGLNHVMTVLNSQVRIQDRNGNVISTVSLNTFWQSLGSPNAFDPRALYDPYADRFIFTAGGDAMTPRSSVLVAVSQTGDPTGGWMLSRVDADQNNLTWADFPAVAFNKNWVVVTVNMFPILQGQGFDFSGVNIYAFNRTNLYANGRQFTLLRDGSTIGFTMMPAVTYDPDLELMHLVDVDSLELNYNVTSRRLRLSTISGPVGREVLNLATAYTTDTNVWASSSPA